MTLSGELDLPRLEKKGDPFLPQQQRKLYNAFKLCRRPGLGNQVHVSFFFIFIPLQGGFFQSIVRQGTCVCPQFTCTLIQAAYLKKRKNPSNKSLFPHIPVIKHFGTPQANSSIFHFFLYFCFRIVLSTNAKFQNPRKKIWSSNN